jgi:hypothetical protein
MDAGGEFIAFLRDQGADANHAMVFQGVFQHGAVTLFEDVQWESSVGKEHSLGKKDGSAKFGDRNAAHEVRLVGVFFLFFRRKKTLTMIARRARATSEK